MKFSWLALPLLALLLPAVAQAQEDPAAESAVAAEAVAEAPAPEAGAVPEPGSTEAVPEAGADHAAIPSADAAIPTVSVEPLRPEDQAPVAQETEVRQLDEVVVTAQKTQQSARRVPISVTAMSGDTMQEMGVSSLAEVSLYVPNVRVDADDLGSPQVFIRGFGTNAFNPSFESSVAFVQDEIYFGRAGYFTEAMFDIDRVEILRGPQGTLFGKNTVAGVFNVLSKRPEQDFEADLRYTHGDPYESRVEGGAGGMVNDWFGARISGLYRKKDGDTYNQYLDRNEEEQEQTAGRLKLRFFPGYGIDSEITAVTSRTEAPFWPLQVMNLDQNTRDYLEAFDPEIEDDPFDFNTSFDTQGFIEKGSDTVGWKTEWNMGTVAGIDDFTPVLVLGWSRFFIDQLNELDVSPADIGRLDNHEDHDQISGEWRFTGHADSLFGLGTGFEFVAGGYYFESEYTLLARILAGGDIGSYILTDAFFQLATEDRSATYASTLGLPALPILGAITGPIIGNDYYQFDYTQKITTGAAFGQFTWNITDSFAITPGVRVSRERKNVNSAGNSHCPLKDQGLPRPCVMALLLGSEDYTKNGLEKRESDVSPKVALQYFTEPVNFYASYNRGYKSGGFNSLSFTDTDIEYQPEKARTYEVGARAKLFDRTLSFNLTLYRTDFEDLQVLAFNGVFFDVATANAESQGLEAEFLWLTPWSPLRIAGSFGLLNAEYTDYPGAPAPIEQGIGVTQDLSGQRVAFAPQESGTLTPTLSFPMGNFMLTLAGDIVYQGDQYTDTDLDPNTYVPAYTKYGARIIFSSADQSWSVSIGGNNLSDERVLNQVTDATFFPGSYFAQQAAGRQLFASLAFRL